MRTLIAYCVLLCFILGATASSAEDKMQCRPLDPALNELMAGAQRANATPIPLAGPRAESFLDVMNAIPPETSVKSDLVLVILLIDESSVVFIRDAGQLCGYWRLDAKATTDALTRAAGAAKS